MNTSRVLTITGLITGLLIEDLLAQSRTSAPIPADYTGTYQYHNGTTLQLLPKDTLLRGVQYCSWAFVQRLRQANATISLTESGDPTGSPER